MAHLCNTPFTLRAQLCIVGWSATGSIRLITCLCRQKSEDHRRWRISIGVNNKKRQQKEEKLQRANAQRTRARARLLCSVARGKNCARKSVLCVVCTLKITVWMHVGHAVFLSLFWAADPDSWQCCCVFCFFFLFPSVASYCRWFHLFVSYFPTIFPPHQRQRGMGLNVSVFLFSTATSYCCCCRCWEGICTHDRNTGRTAFGKMRVRTFLFDFPVRKSVCVCEGGNC